MKKAISLLLALVMCLSLCACSDGSENAEPKNNDTNSETTSSTESSTETTNNHPLLTYMLGEWELELGDDAVFNSIIVNEDGSCIVDGKSATWKIPDGYPSADELFIEVFEGDTMICGVYMYNSVEGYTINCADSTGMICGGFYKKVQNPEMDSQHEIVEITLDNWQEYFELREYQEYMPDAFGDFANIRSWYTIVSKDEFDPFNGSVAIEFTYYVDVCPYTIDLDSKTIIYGDATKTLHYDTPRIESFTGVGQYVGEEWGTRYGVYIMNWDRNKLEDDGAEKIVKVDVTRISGTFEFVRREK